MIAASKASKRTIAWIGCVSAIVLMVAYGSLRGDRIGKVSGYWSVSRHTVEQDSKASFPMREIAASENVSSTSVTQAAIKHIPTPKQAKCSAHRKVVFVKTHKTAGSSVRRIIVQHLERTRARRPTRLPRMYLGGYPGRFDPRFALDKYGKSMDAPGLRPDAIAEHIRFNKGSLEAFMPTGTSYVTILRDPAAAFRSSFNYYYGQPRPKKNLKRMGVPCVYSPFLDIMGKFNASFRDYLKIAPTQLDRKVPWYFRSMNYQAHDLGLDPTRSDPGYIREQIRILDSTFNLVMITEYFAESLVLLREELCMDWSILTSEMINRRKYEVYELSKREQSAVRSLMKQDYALYYHFNRTLWRKINAYGRERMAKDVERIKRPPTAEQIALFKHRRVEEMEETNLDFGEEDVSLNYKADVFSRLTERIAKSTTKQQQHLRVDRRKIEELSRYMIENSGGCNF